ncbi:MAG: hypothetical protein AAFU41_08755 [Pseudomonadota bacterium]
MSKTARTDEIDALVSSVRDFVAHKEPRKSRTQPDSERLVLTDDQRVVEFGAPNAATAVDLAQAATGTDIEATLSTLEAAVTTQPDEWDDDYTVEEFVAASDAVDAFDGPGLPGGIGAKIEQLATEQALVETVAALEVKNAKQDDLAAFADERDAPEINADDPAPTGLAALDEDALRGMISEIVHDELAGALGERITRNVRKLVRKEINRALTSRALFED